MTGIVCEIDETIIVRRKYGRGRVPEKKEVWLFGGVEINTKHEVFLGSNRRKKACTKFDSHDN